VTADGDRHAEDDERRGEDAHVEDEAPASDAATDAGPDDADATEADLFQFTGEDPPAGGAAGTGDRSDGRDDGHGAPPAEADLNVVADLDRDGRVELGVELIRNLELGDTTLAAVVDRIETITTNPATTREILDTAEKRGLIERDGARIRTTTGGTFVSHERQVVRRTGEYNCRRCGASLSTGHFVRLQAGELGPFGSSCIRKVTGRDAD
jgi:hypothetical protein